MTDTLSASDTLARQPAAWDAIVLAGGRSSRLGGIDKVTLEFEGESLLDRALRAVSGARRIVVVGPDELRGRLPRGVDLVTEHPRFGGPAAATATGLRALGGAAANVAVIAADMPRAAEALSELLAVGRLAVCTDGVVAADASGRVQPLLAVYSAVALKRAVEASGDLTNASMRALTGRMLLCQVRLSEALCADIDTPADAERHRIALDAALDTEELAHA